MIDYDQRYKIFKEWPRLEGRKHSFFFSVTDLWNSLPSQVVEAPKVKVFERRLDRHCFFSRVTMTVEL